jgi:hypothetical protein
MREGAGASIDPARLAVTAILSSAAVASLAIAWPGQFTWDSVMQLAEGRRGAYSGQHPPVMSWLLGLADALRPGAGLFTALDVMLVFGGLAALVWTARPVSWVAAPVTLGIVALPQLAVYPAIVWKDVLYAGAGVAGFAALAAAATSWTSKPRRWVALSSALALLVLAALTRQNGAVALPFAAGALGYVAARAEGARRGAAWGVTFLIAAIALCAAINTGLATRIRGAEGVAQQWEHLWTYDLAGAVAKDPGFRLDALHRHAPWLERLLRDDGAPAYTPSRIDPLADDVLSAVDDHRDAAGPLAEQWRDLVLRHPLLYLRVRADDFRWLLLTPRPDQCVMVETGVDGDPADLAAAGLTERDTPRDNAVEAYAQGFVPTPAYSHAAYAVVAAALAIVLLRRRGPADIAVAAMLGAALVFAASFAVIGIACDYRYLYDLDLSAAAAALYAAASFGGKASPGANRRNQARR